MTDDAYKKDLANMELVSNQMKTLMGICANTLDIVREQPTRGEMSAIAENAALKAVQRHERDCEAKSNLIPMTKTHAENTASIDLLKKKVSPSIAPNDKVSIAKWKILAPIVVAGIGLAGTIIGYLI